MAKVTRYYLVEVSDSLLSRLTGDPLTAIEWALEDRSLDDATVTEVHPGDHDVRSDGTVITETQAYLSTRSRPA